MSSASVQIAVNIAAKSIRAGCSLVVENYCAF